MSNSFATPQTIAHQVPLSMGFSGQEYWSGVPLPTHFTHRENKGQKVVKICSVSGKVLYLRSLCGGLRHAKSHGRG